MNLSSANLINLLKAIELDLTNNLLSLNLGVVKCAQLQNQQHIISRAQSIHSINGSTIHAYENYGQQPLLLVPSHINRGYVMDLMPGYSFLSNLQNSSYISPYLLEWNDPIKECYEYDAEQYLTNILIPTVDYLYNKHQRKVIVAGYCMGGLLVTALAKLRPEKLCGIVLIATPWNFHANDFIYRSTLRTYKLISQQWPVIIPKELISVMMQFFQINASVNKLIALGNAQVKDQFSAIENWLDDGLNMTAPLFKTCINNFILQNQPANNKWSVSGSIIDPDKIKLPALCVIGTDDKIVPPSAAMPLALSLPNAKIEQIGSGHVGIVTSGKHQVAELIQRWVKKIVH